MNNKIICKTIYGSSLFGTSTPNSDKDYTSVFMMPTLDLLRRRYVEGYKQETAPGVKNTSTDVDTEFFELQAFIRRALIGQPQPLEMLFTPKHQVLETSHVWDVLVDNCEGFISKAVAESFGGFGRSQAEKYANKAEKYKELKHVVDSIKTKMQLNDKLNDIEDSFWLGLNYFYIKGEGNDRYLVSPGASFPMGRKVSDVLVGFENQLGRYGKRVHEAASNDGSDLKSLHHAMRSLWELEELLVHGTLTFPHPRREELIKIKTGCYDRLYLERWINEEAIRTRELPNNLPNTPDDSWVDDFLNETYMQEALESSEEWLTQYYDEFAIKNTQRSTKEDSNDT